VAVKPCFWPISGHFLLHPGKEQARPSSPDSEILELSCCREQNKAGAIRQRIFQAENKKTAEDFRGCVR
jgi:hypothetical protein